MLRKEGRKLVKVLLLLEGVACAALVLSPFLVAGGILTWFFALLTNGETFGAIGASPFYVGSVLAVAGVCLIPLSIFTLVYSTLQYRKFKTDLSLPAAITAGAHLLLAACMALYLWRL